MKIFMPITLKFQMALFLFLVGSGNLFAQHVDEVRLLVAYTDAVAANIPNPYESLIKPSIESINQTHANSSIGHEVVLARAIQVHYTERDTMFNSLQDFRISVNPNLITKTGVRDPGLIPLEKLKEIYHADVCVLIVDKGKGREGEIILGISSPVSEDTGPTRYDAFMVVKASNMVERMTMAHELGHLYGCVHETAQNDPVIPFAYGHGYVLNQEVGGNHPHTVMAYGNIANEGKINAPILYWSNPNITYNGESLGSASQENAARVIRENYNTLKGEIHMEQITIRQTDTIRNHERMEVISAGTLLKEAGVPYILENGGSGIFYSNNLIHLKSGFHAKEGSDFRAVIRSY